MYFPGAGSRTTPSSTASGVVPLSLPSRSVPGNLGLRGLRPARPHEWAVGSPRVQRPWGACQEERDRRFQNWGWINLGELLPQPPPPLVLDPHQWLTLMEGGSECTTQSLRCPDWEAQDPGNGRDWEGLRESPAPTPPHPIPCSRGAAWSTGHTWALLAQPYSPPFSLADDTPDCGLPERARPGTQRSEVWWVRGKRWSGGGSCLNHGQARSGHTSMQRGSWEGEGRPAGGAWCSLGQATGGPLVTRTGDSQNLQAFLGAPAPTAKQGGNLEFTFSPPTTVVLSPGLRGWLWKNAEAQALPLPS